MGPWARPESGILSGDLGSEDISLAPGGLDTVQFKSAMFVLHAYRIDPQDNPQHQGTMGFLGC